MRLLGEVAHEMRTPLTVLTGRVEGLQDGVFTVDDDLLVGLPVRAAPAPAARR